MHVASHRFGHYVSQPSHLFLCSMSILCILRSNFSLPVRQMSNHRLAEEVLRLYPPPTDTAGMTIHLRDLEQIAPALQFLLTP